jgi:hypothetical protein
VEAEDKGDQGPVFAVAPSDGWMEFLESVLSGSTSIFSLFPKIFRLYNSCIKNLIFFGLVIFYVKDYA